MSKHLSLPLPPWIHSHILCVNFGNFRPYNLFRDHSTECCHICTWMHMFTYPHTHPNISSFLCPGWPSVSEQAIRRYAIHSWLVMPTIRICSGSLSWKWEFGNLIGSEYSVYCFTAMNTCVPRWVERMIVLNFDLDGSI